jgi:DNA-binding MarR family transcriptional regulator
MDADDVARLRIAVARLERRMNVAVTEAGLTQTQMLVLGSVVRHGCVGIGELATIAGLNPTMLSRVIGKLDDAGLIKRVPDPNDRRAALVEPTGAGRRLRARINEKRTALLITQLGALTPEQEESLIAALPALEALAADRSPS